MPTVIRQAPAKINLGLRILGRRPDGYHELRTVFQTISWADRLEIEFQPASESRVEISCDRSDLENDENLAVRAAKALLDRVGVTAVVKIRLDKQIPSGAGLGGGSSDAAAVLMALAEQIEPAPDDAILHELAADLGSDVPFFLVGGTAVGVGRGEEVYPLADLPSCPIVVVTPDVEVSTPWAYRAFAEQSSAKLTPESQRRTMSRFCSAIHALGDGGVLSLTGLIANDFEQTVFRQYPQLETIKQRLLAARARFAQMSGSGSAVFGVFESERTAADAIRTFEGDGVQAVACRFLSRDR